MYFKCSNSAGLAAITIENREEEADFFDQDARTKTTADDIHREDQQNGVRGQLTTSFVGYLPRFWDSFHQKC